MDDEHPRRADREAQLRRSISQLDEPVVLLAAVEEKLKRAERDRQQGEAEHVELALVGLGLGHEAQP